MHHAKVERENLKKASEMKKQLFLEFRYRKVQTSVSTIELPKSEDFRPESNL